VRRVLVVEDDSNLKDMLTEWLILKGYTVAACEGGEEAMEQLSMINFDVILLDWHLTDCTGIDLLRAYRSRGGKAIVLMLTGSTTQAEREEALASGATAYMIKPFKLPELSLTIERLLAGTA
jgi:DNA-binding response OmpR family regulator